MTDIRTAILKAADSIEANPELFEFESLRLPDSNCGTPGCALGWISLHSHLQVRRAHPDGCFADVVGSLKIGEIGFYRRMTDIGAGWTSDSFRCAENLRLYADKYHPETDHIPENIRAIFRDRVAS